MRFLSRFVLMAATLALGLGAAEGRQAEACEPGPDYGPEEVVVETSGKRKRVKLNFRREEYTFAGGHRTLAELQVFTKNKRLIKFLKAKGMDKAMWHVVKKTAERADCATLLVGKRLARLERALKAAVVARYRKKTKRSPGTVDLMLIVEQDQTGITTCAPPRRKSRRL